ncbi:Acyl-CoA N-acyltransferase with RING/FYVE/PHD-type zinc finger domain-containing protein [Trifolium repens]|nr:Acyl-CoA N-acyltransferase with RING/FYVE/PHD-type zinc finger domain-containing protein [Trifolium repens]
MSAAALLQNAKVRTVPVQHQGGGCALCRVNHWDEKIDSIIQKGWKMRLGNGKNIHLWTDKWLVDCPLKEIYSRFFSVSAQRCEFVSNMGFWKDNLWHWNLLWRRQLFQWEVDQLHDLIKLLEAVILTVNTDDKLWWHFDYKGEFSVKSFSKACSSERRLDEDDRIIPSVWRGVAPPRAALLLWDDGFKVTFGPQTLMICTQCEKEYHVGCLKRYCIEDLEELPRGSWFCSNNCRDIHSGLMNLVASGDNSIPEHFQKLMRKKQGVGLDIKWRLLNRKLFPWDDTNPLLSKAHAIFGERFRLMFGSDGADVIRGMILGKNLEDQDLSGFYCAVLTVGRSVVSAALFRVLGSQIAEVPLVATSIKHDGKGYFQCLFGCIERFLASLGVDSFVLHACQQAKPMWIRKFRFSKLGKSEIKHLKRNYKLISLERTELLRKPVEEEN